MKPEPDSVLRYPTHALVADYARAVVGLACAGLPLVLIEPAAPVRAILAAALVLFLVYFARTVLKQSFRVELVEGQIRSRGFGNTTIRWEDLRAVRLNYYSTRQDRTGGWMQLELRGVHGAIRVESSLTGFIALTAEAVRQAGARGIGLDEGTLRNLQALRLRAPGRVSPSR